jgi:hypothetical protein
MAMIHRFAVVLVLLHAAMVFAENRPSVAANDVVWNSLGKNENDSMPVGGGDLAANVWTEQNGDLVLLVSKADAWTELNKLVKLGRIRVQLTPNPFANALKPAAAINSPAAANQGDADFLSGRLTPAAPSPFVAASTCTAPRYSS